jgi:predicted DNA-binding transcriptional regulator YafY
MVGYQPVKQKIQTYGLERIKFIEKVPENSFIEVPFDPDDYYLHLIGVTVPEDSPSEITIKFTNAQGKYILSQPIHESQQLICNDEKSITIKLFLSPSYEFISMVLGWGADAEVIEPLWFREKISSKLRDALRIYK